MFIVIDGPDGSGKTTLAKNVVERVKEKGVDAVFTYEPTRDNEAGLKIRKLLQTGDIKDVYAFSDLFTEDRKAHIKNLILPSLEKGTLVVCDRYKYSSLVYQGLQGVGAEYIIESNRKCLVPGFAFILLPENTDTLIERITLRGIEKDVFEEAGFIRQTIESYKKMPAVFPEEKIVFLDAGKPVEENTELILKYINKKKPA